jgi:starch-binding outer membrane protein, SusD/RagB family
MTTTTLRRMPRGAVLLLALGVAACSDILSLQQSNPGQVEAGTLYVPANAQLLVNSAIGDFECAYSRYVAGSGLLGDEISAALAASANYDYDRRTLATNHPYSAGCGAVQIPGIYTALSIARASADTAYAKFEGWTDAEVPNRGRLMGQLMAYAGQSLLLLGEGMCSAALNVGPEMTSAELFAEARQRFDLAIQHATAANDAQTLNMARLGRARAYLNTGQFAAAGEDAATIPADFALSMTTDAVNARRQNSVFIHITQNFHGTVEAGYRNVMLEGAPDPRVRVTDQNRSGTAPGSQIFTPDKYPAANSPISITRYAEAQLILAEARITAGDLPGAAAAINAARNSGGRTGMPQYSADGQTAEQVHAQLVEERRREFFLEGRRLWDVRRLNLPLVPAPGTPYPGGGGFYGDQRCFPLPDVERASNPNIG